MLADEVISRVKGRGVIICRVVNSDCYQLHCLPDLKVEWTIDSVLLCSKNGGQMLCHGWATKLGT